MTPEERERVRKYVARLDAKYRTLRDEVEEDLLNVRGFSDDDVDRVLGAHIRGTWQLLQGLPMSEHSRLLQREAPASDFAGIWNSLRSRAGSNR